LVAAFLLAVSVQAQSVNRIDGMVGDPWKVLGLPSMGTEI
jgi:hypothetical protein